MADVVGVSKFVGGRSRETRRLNKEDTEAVRDGSVAVQGCVPTEIGEFSDRTLIMGLFSAAAVRIVHEDK